MVFAFLYSWLRLFLDLVDLIPQRLYVLLEMLGMNGYRLCGDCDRLNRLSR